MKRIVVTIGLALLVSGWAVQRGESGPLMEQTEVRRDLGAYLEAQGYTRVPMTSLPTGHFSILGSAGSASLSLIVDTGASHTVIDIARADRFDLIGEDRGSRATGIGGQSQRVETGNLEDVRIGPVSVESLRVTIIDLAQVNGLLRRMGTEPVDGIIGADLLLSRQAVIDFGGPALYFRD